jgi:RHS repeat-associated protein
VQRPTDLFTYTYNALGQRVGMTDNGRATAFVIDPLSGQAFGEVTGGQTTQNIFGRSLVAQVAGGSSNFYAFDASGNTSVLTSGTGAVLNTYSYLPFGEALAGTGSTANRFTYSGAFGVTGTTGTSAPGGLYLTATRAYAAGLGRFTSPDPTGFGGGDTNLYRYIGNSPVRFSDPTGLDGTNDTNGNAQPPSGTPVSAPAYVNPNWVGPGLDRPAPTAMTVYAPNADGLVIPVHLEAGQTLISVTIDQPISETGRVMDSSRIQTNIIKPAPDDPEGDDLIMQVIDRPVTPPKGRPPEPQESLPPDSLGFDPGVPNPQVPTDGGGFTTGTPNTDPPVTNPPQPGDACDLGQSGALAAGPTAILVQNGPAPAPAARVLAPLDVGKPGIFQNGTVKTTNGDETTLQFPDGGPTVKINGDTRIIFDHAAGNTVEANLTGNVGNPPSVSFSSNGVETHGGNFDFFSNGAFQDDQGLHPAGNFTTHANDDGTVTVTYGNMVTETVTFDQNHNPIFGEFHFPDGQSLTTDLGGLGGGFQGGPTLGFGSADGTKFNFDSGGVTIEKPNGDIFGAGNDGSYDVGKDDGHGGKDITSFPTDGPPEKVQIVDGTTDSTTTNSDGSSTSTLTNRGDNNRGGNNRGGGGSNTTNSTVNPDGSSTVQLPNEPKTRIDPHGNILPPSSNPPPNPPPPLGPNQCGGPGNVVGTTLGQALVPTVHSFDPNAITGPAGFGPQAFVAAGGTLGYRIDFQNVPTATAPAQIVTVSQQLDPNLDLSTFQLGSIGFGNLTVSVPPGRTTFSTRVDATASAGVFVDVTASLNPQTGLVTWTFTSIDPTTFDVPTGNHALEGFLPPDTNPPLGEGFVTYTIQPKAADPTGTVLNAQANVVFDTNAPINTRSIFNTLDAGAPTSSINPLPATTTNPNFPVSWSGQDDPGGSGIAFFDVYVSDNGGPFTPFLLGTTATSATYSGSFGHTYGFFSVATDNVGHTQPTPTTAQATTSLGGARVATTLAVTSDQPSGTVYGQAVTFTATVSAAASPFGAPSGTVQFQIDGANFGAPQPLSQGTPVGRPPQLLFATATLTTSALSAGLHRVVAIYLSNRPQFLGSDNHASPFSQNVTPAATTIDLASSASPAVFGQPLTFTALVRNTNTAAAPTGSVQFLVDGNPLGTPVGLGADGRATSVPVRLFTGTTHTVQAVYSNSDGDFLSGAASLTQKLQAAAAGPKTVSPLAYTVNPPAVSANAVADNPGGPSPVKVPGFTPPAVPVAIQGPAVPAGTADLPSSLIMAAWQSASLALAQPVSSLELPGQDLTATVGKKLAVK